MNKKWLYLGIMALAPCQIAYSGSLPAANQSQPTSSVVTTSSSSSVTMNAALSSASPPGQAVVLGSISPSGVATLSVEAPSGTTGQTSSMAATAQMSPSGQVVVTFQDGSTMTFDAPGF